MRTFYTADEAQKLPENTMKYDDLYEHVLSHISNLQDNLASCVDIIFDEYTDEKMSSHSAIKLLSKLDSMQDRIYELDRIMRNETRDDYYKVLNYNVLDSMRYTNALAEKMKNKKAD